MFVRVECMFSNASTMQDLIPRLIQGLKDTAEILVGVGIVFIKKQNVHQIQTLNFLFPLIMRPVKSNTFGVTSHRYNDIQNNYNYI